MSTRVKKKGDLIIIGGNEQKHDGDRSILAEVAAPALHKEGKLVVLTVATELPQEVGQEYRATFKKLGVKETEILDIRQRDEAFDPKRLAVLDGARVLFFTGGDQLRITSQMGGTPLLERLFALHDQGALIVGTSAGAAVMSETMLIAGSGNESRLAGLAMAPGLGLLEGVIVDSHFAQRGRFGRLLGAVAQNPHNIGLGIDEDTAIIVENDERFRVLGTGGVYVFDATANTYTSVSDLRAEDVPSIHDVRLHVLGREDEYELKTRRPVRPREPSHD
jgi:cyanophycinase